MLSEDEFYKWLEVKGVGKVDRDILQGIVCISIHNIGRPAEKTCTINSYCLKATVIFAGKLGNNRSFTPQNCLQLYYLCM